MPLSPPKPSIICWLAYLQLRIFAWDYLLRILVLWLTPIPYDAKKAQSRHIRQAYESTPIVTYVGGSSAS